MTGFAPREPNPGAVAEWSNAPDSKSGVRLCRTVGSNPTCSAKDVSAFTTLLRQRQRRLVPHLLQRERRADLLDPRDRRQLVQDEALQRPDVGDRHANE